MRRYFLLYLISYSACLTAQAEAIYQWTNEKGEVVFSDRYQEGAKKVEVKPPQTIQLENPSVSTNTNTQTATDYQSYYQGLVITQPTDQATVRDTQLNVQATLVKPLQQGHQLQLVIDGQTAVTQTSTNFSLNRPERGQHTLGIAVIDKQQKTLYQSPSITIYSQQTSALGPVHHD